MDIATKITVPVLTLITFVSKTVVLSFKLIVPVGIPDVEDFTVAVNDTFWPKAEGLPEGTSEVEVAASVTVCDTAGDVLPANVVLPSYVTVTGCMPTDQFKSVRVAFPPESVALATVEPASWKSTTPSGVPCGEVTVAVSVTACPKAEGFSEEISDVVL